MNKLITRYKAFPRSMRWLIVFAVFAGVYFVVIEPALNMMTEWNNAADRAAIALRRYEEQATARDAADTRIAIGVTRLGDVAMPNALRDRSNVLYTKIGSILDKHGVVRPSITQGRPIPLGKGVLAELVGANEEVQRLTFDVKLEGDPDTILKVIADLERTPEVTTLGTLQLRRTGKDDERKLQATLTPEAWVIAERGGRR